MAINIALAGNPNCGKTTMFNDLTGANQYVGNWPGVTVEKKEGRYRADKEVVITDLPGVYSLSPYTPEEIVTRDYLMSGKPDAVINLVDATNLERNLYLTTQIIDLGIPTVVALNMMDLVEKNGDKIDVDALAKRLGCPVVPTSALKGRGMEEVVKAAIEAGKKGAAPATTLRFTNEVEEALAQVIDVAGAAIKGRHARWYAIKLLEGEQLTIDALNLPAAALSKIAAIRERLEDAEDDDAESIITNERYDNITEVCDACVRKSPKTMTTTQKIDRVVTNRILGIPIFIVIMFLVYYISVSTVGTIVTDWANDGLFGDGWLYTGTEQYEAAVEEFEGILETDEGVAAFEAGGLEEPDPADYGLYHVGVPVVVGGWLESIGAAPWVQSLVLDGIIAGVGAVIGFIPQLIVLFILLGFLEGCGYMARVAFIMDRVFRRFGLSGKSFIPMLIASGCGVPAVMATKTIENEKDRRMTIMTTTMIPCGAKLPIIALVFGALAGGDYEATWWVAPVFYFLGLFAIILSCIILKKFRAFSGEVAPFIMELPQYHLPTVKNVLLSMWERVRSYVVKAGTIIFLSSMVIWFLLNFGFYEGSFGLLDPEVDDYIQYSLMAGLGNLLAWIFAPLGFGNWESTVTSITGLVAKENVVATVGVITSLGEEIGETDPSLWASFAAMLGGSSAAIMAFCAFNLLCAPCFAAIGTIRRQMMSAKWTWAAIGYMCAFAWCVGLMIYQFGGLIAGEITFGPFTALAVVVAAGMLYLLFRPAAKPKGAGKLETASKNA
ncbi:ferrous iron transporter B [Adlercreutzia equolifaciens subsp. celatus]|uniref:Fe(2+) transporter FeoB n=1 Tax=Adlercreutzia equolifaciens subsp. celatus TaxID=394340 RepID=A0A369NZL1_9ACTN|nr:ferrous iron transporter B [Adlercreutzia equolifaciens]RDC44930.1 ferrous iron transporter B [Adlercreutzia equolifaciens subsp. celatus]